MEDKEEEEVEENEDDEKVEKFNDFLFSGNPDIPEENILHCSFY